MSSIKKLQEIMTLILTTGTLSSFCLVVLGGGLYLLKHGANPIQIEVLQSAAYVTNMVMVLKNAFFLEPVSMIELGLLLLVLTQIVRVAMLVWFYSLIRDHWFTGISLFVLSLLSYSFIRQFVKLM